MKKFILILSLLTLIAGCGDSEYGSKRAKEKFIEKVVAERRQEVYTSYEEYKRITEDLKSRANQGDKKARKEYEEWGDVVLKVTDGAGIEPDLRGKSSGVFDLINK